MTISAWIGGVPAPRPGRWRGAAALAMAFAAAVLLAGCAAGPGIPDTVYFRMPPPMPPSAAPAEPAYAEPIVVETFFADGVHSDQAILYSLDPDAARIRAYHYQLWADPPTRMLQQRLIVALRTARVAPLVTERLPPKQRTLRITARIEAFERVQREDGWHVQVALQLRADRSDEARPRLLRDYSRDVAVGGDSVRDAVRAIGQAVDAIYADFITDLRAVRES